MNIILVPGVQHSDHPDKSSTHLTPNIVITVLLTISHAVLYIPYSVTISLYFIPSPFSPIPPKPLPSGNLQNVLCTEQSDLYRTRRNKLVSAQATRINGIPKCAESSGSGRWMFSMGPGWEIPWAGPGMFLVRTRGRKPSLP